MHAAVALQEIFGNLDKLGWWDMEIDHTDARMQFTYKVFQKGLSVHGVRLALGAPDHKEMIGQVELKWRIL